MSRKYEDPSGAARVFRIIPEGGLQDGRLELRADGLNTELIAICEADNKVLSQALKRFPADRLGELEVFARRLMVVVEARKIGNKAGGLTKE